jgi:hypothetical protein
MRTTHFFYYMLIILTLTGLVYCGNGNTNAENGSTTDSTAMKSDSAMSAHNRDPSTAYPEPPVTGSNVDSSRTKDSLK